MADELNRPRGYCANCGKEIPVPTLASRDQKAYYCGRVCSSLRFFKTRYRGTMSGPADIPTFTTKGKKFGEGI